MRDSLIFCKNNIFLKKMLDKHLKLCYNKKL